MSHCKRICLLIFLLFLAGVLVWAGAVRAAMSPKLLRFEGETMGTAWHVSVISTPQNHISKEKCAEIQTLIEESLKEVDFRMSTWKDFTELSRLNAQKSIETDFPLSPELALVLKSALSISEKTDGAYDVTVGPLVNLWKFGPTRGDDSMPEIPDEAAISDAKSHIGWQSLTVLETPSENSVQYFLRRTKPELYVDLSSIAKGYGTDCASAALEKMGVENYMVEVGGEVRTRGTNRLGKPWRLGISLPVPDSNQLFGAVELNDEALATSGDYRNFKLEGSTRLSHIIDPRTGRPIEHALVSVSVLSQDCMTADAWATALLVLGPEEGVKVAQREHLRVLFLIQDGQKIVPKSVGFPCIPNPYLDKQK